MLLCLTNLVKRLKGRNNNAVVCTLTEEGKFDRHWIGSREAILNPKLLTINQTCSV
jgi:hypothetical protein